MSDEPPPTICLGMIVKDEAAVIERCLSTVSSQIDSWIIIDTGSHDDTCQRVEKILGAIPGRIEHRQFIDFGHNRTELMELAFQQRPTWILLLDADMVLEVEGDLHDLLAQQVRRDMLLVDVIDDDTELALPHLVRGNRHWKFEGVTHEFVTTGGRPRPGHLPGVRIRHFADGASRADRHQRDRRLLEAEHERKPDDPRTLFYLAQTYRDLGETNVAVRYYSERAAMDSAETWDEETFYAQYQVGVLQMDSDWPAAADALLRAWSMRPTRAEPLYQLAFGWRNKEVWAAAHLFASRGVHIPEPGDVLFVDRPLYRWGLRFERSVAAWYAGERDLALEYTKELLADPELPEHWRFYAEGNLRVTS